MLALSNLSAVLNSTTNVEVNNSLSNLLDETYRPSLSVTMTDNKNGTNKFDISFNSELILKRNDTSNNVSLVSNFKELPVIGILTANIEETIQQGLFEVIQTKQYNNEIEEIGIKKEFISYIQKNNKDYFYILNSTDVVSMYKKSISEIENEILICTDKVRLNELENLKNEYIKNIKSDTEKPYLRLIRIYTMYISTSIGIYTDSKAVRNARKSKKDK